MAVKSDDIDYTEYAALLIEVYGDKVAAEELAGNNEGFDKFLQQAEDLTPYYYFDIFIKE